MKETVMNWMKSLKETVIKGLEARAAHDPMTDIAMHTGIF